MLSSRRSSAISSAREDQRRRGAAPSARGAAAPSGAGAVEETGSGATPDHLLLLGRSLEAGRVRRVGPGVVLGDELQPGVHLAGAGEVARDLRQVQLHDREEALEVRLLVDREVQLIRLQQLERLRERVVATSLDALLAQLELLDDLADALGRSGVDGEHPFDVLV